MLLEEKGEILNWWETYYDRLHSGIGKRISSLDGTALSWKLVIDEIIDIPLPDKGIG